MYDCIDSRRSRVEGEPELGEPSVSRPRRNPPTISDGDVLGEGGEEDVPPVVPRAGRLLDQQVRALVNGLVPVLLQELGNQPPAVIGSLTSSQITGEID